MVRGLSALLAAYAASLTYLLIAPALPAIADSDAAVIVAGGVGLLAVAACALTLTGAWHDPFALGLIAFGSGLIAAALTAADAQALEIVSKAMFGSALGMLLAWGLRSPTVVVAVALLVAGIDLWSVLTGPAYDILRDRGATLDLLSLPLPGWGGGTAARLGVGDVVLLGLFAAEARRQGLRVRATDLALACALLAALAVAVVFDRPVPALTGLSLAFLLPNLDLLPRVVGAEHDGR